jgi:PAS domain S-box-containing protein
MGRTPAYNELEQKVEDLERQVQIWNETEKELLKSRNDLKRQVRERTSELTKANKRLQKEIEERGETQSRLKDQKEFLEATINAASDGIFLLDDRVRYFLINPACGHIVGKRPEEWIGNRAGNFIDPEDKEIAAQGFAMALGGGQSQFEIKIQASDDSYRLLMVKLNSLNWRGKRFVLGVVTDLTELRRAEEEVKTSEAHLRSLMESATGFAVYRLFKDEENPYGARVVFVSPSIRDITGISEPDRFETWFENIHPEDVERVTEANKEAFKTHQFNETMRIYYSQKGEWRWIQAISTSVPNREGEPTYTNGIIIDITEAKRAEKALKESEGRYRLLVETMNEGIGVLNENNIITYVNEWACKMSGYASEEVVGRSVTELFDEAHLDTLKTQIENRKRGLSGSYELVLYRKDGKEVPVILSGAPIFDTEGRFRGSFAVMTDISALKETEESLRNREKELVTKSRNLEDVNAALHVLLENRDKEKIEFQEKILLSLRQLVEPYIDKLMSSGLKDRQKTYLQILESNLKDIISPFSTKLSSKYLSLSPTEIQVANLIRQGKTTTEIADLLNSSKRTVDGHRYKIRQKLGLKNKKANLRTHLLSSD